MEIGGEALFQSEVQRTTAQVRSIESSLRNRREDGLREAAEAFESYFLQVMWSVMRNTVPEGGLIKKGLAHDIFQGMLDQALSEISAKSGGIGLANLLVEQLTARNMY